MNAPERINPHWVCTILKSRGVVVGELPVMKAALQDLGDDEVEQLRACVTALHKGSETSDQMDWAAAWARRARQTPLPVTSGRAPLALEQEAPATQSGGEGPRRDASPAARPRRANRLQWPHHVYGAKAAMCIEVVELERPEDRDDHATVQLEFARAIGDRYDWDDKHAFRLGRRELPLLAGVLLGASGALTLSGHGRTHDKILTVQDQGGHLFFKFRQGRVALGVPLTAGDLVETATRVMHALMLNAPGIDSQTLTLMCRRAGQLQATSLEMQKGAHAGME